MSLRHAMLGLLVRGPASGYDLLKTFEQSLANVWPATQSQLYTELGRLTDAGLVTVHAEGPRGRKEYVITDAGHAELHHWITEVAPDPPRRNDALLRVFFLDQLAPAEARTYLESRAAASAEYHAQLLALRDAVSRKDGPLATYGQLTIEYGIRLTETTQEWALWAAAQIEDADGPVAVAPGTAGTDRPGTTGSGTTGSGTQGDGRAGD